MAYYTFPKSVAKGFSSARYSSLGIRKASDGTYYSTKSNSTKYGGTKVSKKPGSSSGGSSSGSYGGSGSTVSLSNAKVGDLRKISSSGRKYYYTQDQIDKRDKTGSYAPAQQSLSSSKIAEIEQTGANLGWSAQQIQWAKDAALASLNKTPPPAGTPPPTTPDGAAGGGDDTTGDDEGTPSAGAADFSALDKSEAYKKLSADDKEAVRAVFAAIANNDQEQASRLVKAFKASSKINDPYFAQKMRLAVDAIERGYVAIDKQAEFQEKQLVQRRNDLKADLESKRDFLTLEQATQMKELDRNYGKQLENLQQNLAASGFSSSSRREKQRGFLDEATGDVRESSQRRFAYEKQQDERQFSRADRDTKAEVKRLKELTEKGKLDFLRKAEEKVGTGNLPSLSDAPDALGDIYGSLPEDKLRNTIQSATSFVF